MRVFLAGAAGAVGRRLVPLLLRDGHVVFGTTRSGEKAQWLRDAGAEPVLLDVYDAPAVRQQVAAARPDALIHQLTDLPQDFSPERLAASLAANARLRVEGTANLMAAAVAAGVRRVVAQSIAFVYAPGHMPHGEDAPLDPGEGPYRETVQAVLALERAVTQTPGIEGLVLRYGRFYGPGTWREQPAARPALHVDAAAHAARLALTRGAPGIYNIADDDGEVAIDKARRELRFDPGLRAGAEPVGPASPGP